MDPSMTFKVSRARPADAEVITDFVSRSTHGRISVVPELVVERFGAKGLWLVKDTSQQIVGLAGWRAENLIARIDDFLIFPLELYPSAGKALLTSIEDAAQELRCEVSILLVPWRASQRAVDFYENSGYSRAEPEELPRVWQEMTQEATQQNRYLMLKQLREDLITRPM